MARKMTQKDVWSLMIEQFENLRKNKVKFKYHVELENIFDKIEEDNNVVIPVEWKWRLRKKLDNYLMKDKIESRGVKCLNIVKRK